MAITAITPASGTPIEAGDSAAFTIDDTYTSLVIKVQTSTALVVAYSTALGGAQSGYVVSVQDNGDGTHTVTYSADAGWDVHPQLIYVVEDETGTEATTGLSYDIIGESPYPQGSYPYNAISGPVVASFNSRTGVVVPAAGDYDAFYYTEAESDALFAAYLPLAGGVMSGNITMAGAETVDGRDLSVDGTKLDGVEALADVTDTANVTAAGALMDSEVTNLSGIKTLVVPDSTTITTFIATLTDDTDAATARTTLDAARAMLSGAGAPGVSTGNTYPLGTTYADTTADVGYILVDATTDANVWASGSGATYLSGAGAPGVSTGNGEVVGTTYIDTTADEAYFLCDATTDANVWSTATGAGGGGGGGNFTLANNVLVDSDKTEIVIGGAYIDGSTGGTYSWEILGTYNNNGGAGNQDIEIRLYDRGPDGTPVAGVLRSVLEIISLDTLDRVSLTLTASASPGVDTDTIYNTARMYEVRAYLDATGGVDTAKILSVAFVEA
jgi:hypothetical protein